MQNTKYANLKIFDLIGTDKEETLYSVMNSELGINENSNINIIDRILEALDKNLKTSIITLNMNYTATVESVELYEATFTEFNNFENKMLFLFYFSKDNIEPVSIKINNLPYIPIVKIVNGNAKPLQSNDIKKNVGYFFQYDDAKSHIILIDDNLIQKIKEIDTEITNIKSNKADKVNNFIESTTRNNISNLDELTTILSKLSKWYSDFGQLAWEDYIGIENIYDNLITDSKLSKMSSNTIKGRKDNLEGSPQNLTADEVRKIINVSSGANNTEDTLIKLEVINTILNTDYFFIGSENPLKKILFNDIKSILKNYFDTIYTKENLGLDNVENTPDNQKNVFSASKLSNSRKINKVDFDGTKDITIYDDTKIPISEKGVALGVVPLNAKNKIDNIYLNSDVENYESKSQLPSTGTINKIYNVYNDSNKTNNGSYIWNGTAYVVIGSPIEFATEQEAIAGTIDNKIISPKTNKAVTNNIMSTVNNKVDKVTGKGLSTNDFDNNYKTKVDNSALGLTKNVVYYVSTTGNDSNDGTESKPFKTIAKAISAIPKILNGFQAVIRLVSGTHIENVTLNGFIDGKLYLESVTLNPNDAIINGKLTVSNCQQSIINAITISTQFTGTNDTVAVIGNSCLIITNTIIDAGSTNTENGSCLNIAYEAKAILSWDNTIKSSIFKNAKYGVRNEGLFIVCQLKIDNCSIAINNSAVARSHIHTIEFSNIKDVSYENYGLIVSQTTTSFRNMGTGRTFLPNNLEVQTAKIGNTAVPKSGTELQFPAYPDTSNLVAKDYLFSRNGGNLITNGDASFKNTYNFDNAGTIKPEKWIGDDIPFGTAGAFTGKYGAAWLSVITTEFIPVKNTFYKLSIIYKTLDASPSAMNFMMRCYDIDKNIIAGDYVSQYPNTMTTLAQPIKNGDTKIYLTSLDNWKENANTRQIQVWGYKNSYGYEYPEGSYTRHVFGGFQSKKWEIGAFNLTEKSITLNAPWNVGGFEAGRRVSQVNSGGTHCLILGIPPNTEYKYYMNYIKGVASYPNYIPISDKQVFYPGTAYIKPVLEFAPSVPPALDSTYWFTNWFLKELDSYTTKKNVTLQASAWTGATAPFSQAISNTDITVSSSGSYGLADTATIAQRESARNASIFAKQENGKLTFYADGEKPTIDIPIMIEVTNYAI